MYEGAILGATAAVVFVIIIIAFAIVLFRYRKYRQLKNEKERISGNFYVNMVPDKSTKQYRSRKTGMATPMGKTDLCQGLLKVVDHNEQLPLDMEDIGNGFTIKRASPEESQSNCWSPSMRQKKRKPVKSHSLSSILTTKKSSIGLSQVKSKVSKSQRSAHSMTSPQYFETAQEAVSASQGAQQTTEYCDSDEDNEPEIALSMLYNDMAASLTVTVLCITNLNQKLGEENRIYVQAILRPRNHPKQTSQTVSALSAEFNECFYFEKVRISDLPMSHLTLTVSKKSNNKKIAELFVNMASIEIEYGVTTHFKFPLVSNPRSRRKSTLEKLLDLELGQILLLLHYQPIPNRMKVVVIKANQLPKSESLPFKPDYQVVIELYNQSSHQLLESKHTSAQYGESPVWNEAFLFNLTTNRLDDHYLEFTVLEKRRYKPNDAVIGHVLLGPAGTSSQAISQWNDCSLPYKLEVAQWHTVLPVVKYNVETAK